MVLKAFTRNYEDNSTEAGYQFTFYCDVCQDGFKSTFIESSTYNKKKSMRGITEGVSILGNLIGGKLGNLGYGVERAGYVLSERFEERSPEWQKEHEAAFEMAQKEAQQHFHRCHSCHRWVCDADFNENEGMCVECAPRQEIYVAKAKSDAMRRNIDEMADTATVWSGELESKTTVCPVCGKPSGTGKFCNNCGASLALTKCPACGKENAQGVKFCNYCGASMITPPKRVCPACGKENEADVKFCGECGQRLD